MTEQTAIALIDSRGVSLVDGDATIRRARQLLLRSEHYEVRSYPTCAALLADPQSRAYRCIVVDIDMDEGDGIALLREMRATGWVGKAILLDGIEPNSPLMRAAEEYGDKVLARTIADGPLIAAIAASLDRDRADRQAAFTSHRGSAKQDRRTKVAT
jgi:FixJ family two-component response regulator